VEMWHNILACRKTQSTLNMVEARGAGNTQIGHRRHSALIPTNFYGVCARGTPAGSGRGVKVGNVEVGMLVAHTTVYTVWSRLT